MAWLEKRGKTYRVNFRYDGKHFGKSLKTGDQRKAEADLSRLEENIGLMERGRLELPAGVDLATFLLSDGKLNGKPKAPTTQTLDWLFQEYRKKLPAGAMEDNSLATIELHMKHLLRHFGSRFVIQNLSLSNLQDYVELRSREKGIRGRLLSPTTIRKEITTLSGIWNWAVQMEHVRGQFPNRGLKYPKTAEKPPFRTWAEIDQIVSKNEMTECEARDLWDCLFLELGEVEELLQFVKEAARHRFVYPMYVFAAHTGARRSEIIRSQTSDFDFDGQTVLIREKKRVKGKQTTRRVPLTPLLVQVMREWFSEHPGSMYSIGQEKPRVGKGVFSCLTRDEAHHHFKETLSGSKWEKIRGFHVLRHSFASNCAARGVDQRIINGWMGHQTEEMVNRYRHLLPNQQQQAIELVFGS